MAKKGVKKEKAREIPVRNYVIAIIIVIAVIVLTVYIIQLYNLRKEQKISESYLIKNNTVSYEIKNLEELDSVLAEAPNEYFLYISYTGEEEIYEMEKKLDKVISDYDLQDKIYYLNITNIKDKDEYLELINKTLAYKYEIKKVPTILYIKDGNVVPDGVVIREDQKIIESGDFEKLLEMYEIPKKSQ